MAIRQGSVALAGAVAAVLSAAGVAAEPNSEREPARNLKIEIRPALERAQWEVSFPQEISEEEYARQLEFFKIEVAAVSKDNTVEYVTQLTQKRPGKRVGKRHQDPRLYIGWLSGSLEDVDRRLLARGRVNPQRKEVVHYFPPATQKRMAELEQEYAGRDPGNITRTRFEIHPLDEGGYEFVVVEQDAKSQQRESVLRGALNDSTTM